MFALTTITHDGVRYLRGDALPDMPAGQLDALLAAGVVADAAPGDEPPPPQVRMIRRRPWLSDHRGP